LYNVYFRYRQGKICGDTKSQNEQNTRGYLNDAFTNDYATIGKSTTYISVPLDLKVTCDTRLILNIKYV
jgi:hypothetical protein